MLPNGPYNFTEEEARILDYWLQNGFYKPEYNPKQGRVVSTEEMKKDSRTPWSLICPPPNAYGRPHIGNLSGYAYQDAMARYARMQGKKVLMIPGKDHAGLEGEGVFVRDVLEKQGRNKFDMTREEFYKEIWDFNMQNMQLALADEKSIGLSADFDRNIFTLDPKIVDTVLSTFVQMYNEQMIYKGVRIVNWDPKARSAVADNQCIREERDGTLYTIKYPLVRLRSWKLNFRKSEILEKIRTGEKTIETRALNPEEPERYFGDIKAGDILICIDKSSEEKMSVYKKVKKVEKFESLKVAFEKVEWSRVGFVPESADALLNSYNEMFAGYGDKINQTGLVAIELEDLNDSDYITIATTRPETIPADTAIAMNPEDERYKEFRNFKAIIPFTDREVPIISSFRVDKDFGTGCLKVTPAHAIEDYLIMQEWNGSLAENGELIADSQKISYINVIGQDLKLCGPVPEKYKGRKYKEAKCDMINELTEAGLLINEEHVKQNVLIAERTKAQIEPLISSQWFVDIEKIRKPVIEMVKSGEVTIHPKNMEQKFYYWMENLRDWAISRSLWWGYRMPVWYAGPIEERIDAYGKVETWIHLTPTLSSKERGNHAEGMVGEAVPLDPANENHMRVQLESPGERWIQDENVLDTWFSSGQWPYATLEAYDLMDTFYPTSVMETGFDILENWVSRMMMFSYIKHKQIPFKDVYLHGLVLGPDGQKMSKSRGNLVNIDDAKRDYGTDAIRMVYFYQNKAGSDYTMSNDKLKNFKQFMNKIWNASRFVLMNQPSAISHQNEMRADSAQPTADSLNLELSKLIITHITDLKEKVTKNIENFEFGYATETLYESFWHTFCDIYLEEAKKHLYAQKNKETGEILSEPDEASKIEIQQILMYTLKEYLKMLHPFIPFITQRIWNEVPKTDEEHECLMYTGWNGQP